MNQKEERFAEIVRQQHDKILRICQYYAPSQEDRKDIYQEILVNVWKSLDTFRGEASLATWIYRIAINTSLNFAGKEYRRLNLNVTNDMHNLHLLTDDEEMAEQLNKEQQYEALQVHLNQLSVIDKAIMSLVLEGLSTKEIAEIIGITEPNVRVKIHRIKGLLRDQLNK